jgi:FkbM family methyltransferase
MNDHVLHSIGRKHMTSNFALSIHHVGGRGGSRRFPALASFESDVVNVLYEADRTAIEEMQQQVSSLPSQQIVIEACVGSAAREHVTFHQLWNPAASSYLPVSESFRKNSPYMTEDVLDYDEKAWDTIEATELETASIDQLISQEGKAPPPDFLSLNTQGSELEILRGAAHILESHVLAVQTEFSFQEIYEGQAAIDDIMRYLRGSGFRIAKLLPHGTRGHAFRLGEEVTRTPIGLRGGGAIIQADALFIKDPQYILDFHDDPSADMTKALFFGFILNYFEYSYACAKAIQRMDLEGVNSTAVQFRYARFVAEYLKAIGEYPKIFPPVWTKVFASGSGERLHAAAIRAAYFSTVDKEYFLKAVEALIDPEYFGIELVALRYELEKQANDLRTSRLASIWNNLRYLGLVDDRDGGVVELHLERIS